MWARSLGLGFLIGFLLSFMGVAAVASQPPARPPSAPARLQPALADDNGKGQLQPPAAGDHQVLFLGQGERLILGHVAESREIFATGALAAARFLAGRPPGRYAMEDVLGLAPG